jgi:hypothetical protein
VVDHAALHVGLGAEDGDHRLREVAGVAAGVEGDDVSLKQALEHSLSHVGWQDAPEVWLGPGNVDEEREKGSSPKTLPDEVRGHVELVVVEEHRRGRLVSYCIGHGLGEVAVDGNVAFLPSLSRVVTEHG